MKGMMILLRTSLWIILAFALFSYVIAIQNNYDTFTTTLIGVIIGFFVANFVFHVR